MDILFADLSPLEGSHSQETFLASGPGGRSVVRLYTGAGQRHGPDAANIDAALLQWMQPLLPVPEVLEVRRADPSTGLPALLVTSWLPGTPGARVVPACDARQQKELARHVATILQRLSLVRTPNRGVFMGPRLEISAPSVVQRDAETFLRQEGRGLMEGWSRTAQEGLRAAAGRAQELLDRERGSCLVHGDFQLSNLLLSPALEVIGLVDWELARSGSRFTDLGRLLRDVPGSAFEVAVCEALDVLDRVLGMTPPEKRLESARAADLVVMIERVWRGGHHPEVAKIRSRLRDLR